MNTSSSETQVLNAPNDYQARGSTIQEIVGVCVKGLTFRSCTSNISKRHYIGRRIPQLLEYCERNNILIKKLLLESVNINIQGVMSISMMNTINYLNLDGNVIDNYMAKVIASMNCIRVLHLSRCRVMSEGSRHILSHPKIHTLEMDHNDIDDDGIEPVANNTVLYHLDLSFNNIGNKGSKYIAENRSIKILVLNRCCVSDEGLIELSKNRTIENITISCSMATPSGLSAFLENPTLIKAKFIGDYGDIRKMDDNKKNSEMVSRIYKRTLMNMINLRKRTKQTIETLIDVFQVKNIPKDIMFLVSHYVPLYSSESISAHKFALDIICSSSSSTPEPETSMKQKFTDFTKDVEVNDHERSAKRIKLE